MNETAGKLTGKVAVVTGAGRGIGRAIALKLAAEGASVIANDLDEAPLQEVVEQISAAGGRAGACPGDVTAADFGERLVGAALAAHGDLHLVVNNAGYIWNSSTLKHTDEQWQAMLDVHATAPFRILRAAGAHFRAAARRERERGTATTRKVVNVSSISGVYGAATQLGYSTAKAAVIGMTRTLSKEWGRYNVTVNCVAFGHVLTRLTPRLDQGPQTVTVAGREHGVGLEPELYDFLRRSTPLGRVGTVADAAGAVFLFCIPESDFISGQVVVASGGLVY